MGGRVGLGVRFSAGAAIAATLLFGLAGQGGARVADVSTISIGNATGAVTEGQNASFPVTIDPAASADFTVPFTTSEGLSGSFAVTTGDTSETVAVPTASNSTPEDDRSFSVTLGTPTDPSGAIGTATGTGTIVDDDWQISAIATTPDPPAVSEKGGATIDFQVSLNGGAAPPTHQIKVNYAVADGSAQLGRDYTITSPAGQASGTLTFAPGSSTVDVQIASKSDNLYGTNRQFTVTFSNAVGATFAGGNSNEQTTATISEADAPPLLGINNCTGGTVNGGGVASFPILLGGTHPPTTLPASVDVTTVDDSTIAGDYEPVSQTVTIPVGSREYDLQVQTDANPPTGDRTFHVQVSNPQNVRLDQTAGSCTIHSTTSGGGGGGGGNQPSVAIATPPPVTEPSSGSTPVTLNLNLTAPTPQPSNPGPVSVHWQTQDGTAKAGADYTAASGDVTWAAGQYGQNPTPITVSITANPATTSPVSFTVAFTSSDATFAGSATATITIVPPGSTIPLVSISNASVQSHAGFVPVGVSLTPAATGVVTVNYATTDGTGANAAVAGANYTATSGTLTFQPGETTKTISVSILPNTTVQPNRTFTVNLSNPTGGSEIAAGSATVTILNDYSVTVVPPTLLPKSSPLQHSVPLPQQQPAQTSTQTHLVLLQMETGTSQVNTKGVAVFKVSCPAIVVQACTGKAVFEVRVKQTVKTKKGKKLVKKTVLRTVRVANGSFRVLFGRTGNFNAKVTPAGMKLLRTYKTMRVKATLSSTDAEGAKGVTAWIVSLQAPTEAKVTTKSTKAARLTIKAAKVAYTKKGNFLQVKVVGKAKVAKLRITLVQPNGKHHAFFRKVRTNRVVRVPHMKLAATLKAVRVEVV